MKLATCSQMRAIDKSAVEEFNIPGIILMENAALSVFLICKRLDAYASKKVVILCGSGNNGGDGFAIARHMYNDGAEVIIVLTGEPEKIKADARVNYNICVKLGVEIQRWVGVLPDYPLIIDAMLGTGVIGELQGAIKSAVLAINSSDAFVVAIDCPTGGDPDTGKVTGLCVQANMTVTLALVKPGLLLYPLADYTGLVEIGNISAPPALLENYETGMYALDTQSAAKLLPKRRARSHKGSYGKVVIVSGSLSMTGAAGFCARAAYNAGCGYVDICAPAGVIPIIQQLAPQAVTTPLPERDGYVFEGSVSRALEKINKSAVCLIGPGLGDMPGVAEFVRSVIKNSQVPLIIDADALNAISPEILKAAGTAPVITPHPLEMSRLTGLEVKYILDNLPAVATAFSNEYRAITVLKDATTVIAGPSGMYINKGGCSALAKAGSGDILAGIIAGLMAQGLDKLEAAALGVFIHGRSGLAAAEKYGSYSVGSDEILRCIHEVFMELE